MLQAAAHWVGRRGASALPRTVTIASRHSLDQPCYRLNWASLQLHRGLSASSASSLPSVKTQPELPLNQPVQSPSVPVAANPRAQLASPTESLEEVDRNRLAQPQSSHLQLADEIQAFITALREQTGEFADDQKLLQALRATWDQVIKPQLNEEAQVPSKDLPKRARMKVLRLHEILLAVLAGQKRYNATKKVFELMRDNQVTPTWRSYHIFSTTIAMDLLQHAKDLTLAAAQQQAESEFESDSWQDTVQLLAHDEDRDLFRMSSIQRRVFHEKLHRELMRIVEDYLATIREPDQPSAYVFDRVLMTGARNGLPHESIQSILRVMLSHEIQPNAYTFRSLLRSARFSRIITTLTQYCDLVTNQVVKPNEQDALWFRAKAYRSLIYSVNEEVFDGHFDVEKAHQARNVFSRMEKLFQENPEVFGFDESKANLKHLADVYQMRIQAATLVGFKARILPILDSYLALVEQRLMANRWDQATNPDEATVLTQEHVQEQIQGVLLTCLKCYPAVPVRLMMVTEKDWQAEKQLVLVHRPDFLRGMERRAKNLTDKHIPRLIEQHDKSCSTEQKQLEETIEKKFQELERIRAIATEKDQRIEQMWTLATTEAIVKRAFGNADKFVHQVFLRMNHHLAINAPNDPKVLDALLQQYFACAHKYNSLRNHTKKDWPMFREALRVRVTACTDRMSTMYENLEPQLQEQLEQPMAKFLSKAALTCLLLSHTEEAELLLDRKQRVLHANSWELWDYEQMIHAICRGSAMDLKKAFQHLQSLHNAGNKPTSAMLGHLVLGQILWLRQREKPQASTKKNQSNKRQANQETPRDGRSLADVVSFVETWYNMTKVVPTPKAAIALLDELQAKESTFELTRFLLILEGMKMDDTSVAVATWIKKYDQDN